MYCTYQVIVPWFVPIPLICEPVEERNISVSLVLTRVKSMMAGLLLARGAGLVNNTSDTIRALLPMRGDAATETGTVSLHLRNAHLKSHGFPPRAWSCVEKPRKQARTLGLVCALQWAAEPGWRAWFSTFTQGTAPPGDVPDIPLWRLSSTGVTIST